jgi:hypothetical protein
VTAASGKKRGRPPKPGNREPNGRPQRFRITADSPLSEPRKTKGGGPAHHPTDKTRLMVRALAIAFGPDQGHDKIAIVLDCSLTTMRRHYERELKVARLEADAAVSQSILMQAIGGPDQNWREAVPAMSRLYAETRLGWKPPPQEIKHGGAIGQYDLTKVPLDKLEQILAILEPAAAVSDPSGNSEAEGGAGT